MGNRHIFRSAALCALVAAATIALSPRANAATLTGFLDDQSGPVSAVAWIIGVHNGDAVLAATNAEITGFALAQTAGAPATPVVLTTFPVALGTIAPNANALGEVDIDFTGTPSDALFQLIATFTADGLTGSLVLPNLKFEGSAPPPIFPPVAATPLPAGPPLCASGLGALGLLGWRRKRQAPATA